MKQIIISLLLVMAATGLNAQNLFVGSYNIRYQNNSDAKNGNSWKQRCPRVCGIINFEQPDVFGAQEVLYPQLKDMLATLDGYDYIGVGRDDGKRGVSMPPYSTRKTISDCSTKDSSGWLRTRHDPISDGMRHVSEYVLGENSRTSVRT